METMTKAERVARALQLFRFFVKIGFFTFGGGWSILAQMQSEFVERRQWLTQEELLDIVSVGRSLPGIMIANISAPFGYHMGGAQMCIRDRTRSVWPQGLWMSFIIRDMWPSIWR